MGFITSMCCCDGPPAEYYRVYAVTGGGGFMDSWLYRSPSAEHLHAGISYIDEWSLPFTKVTIPAGANGTVHSIYASRKSSSGKLWGIVRLSQATTGAGGSIGYFVADVADIDNPVLDHLVYLPSPDVHINLVTSLSMQHGVAEDFMQYTWVKSDATIQTSRLEAGDSSSTFTQNSFVSGSEVDFPTYKTLAVSRRTGRAIGLKVTKVTSGSVYSSVTYSLAVGDCDHHEVINETEILSFELTNSGLHGSVSSAIARCMPLVIDYDTDLNGDHDSWIITAPDAGDYEPLFGFPPVIPFSTHYSTNIKGSSTSTTTSAIGTTVPIAIGAVDVTNPYRVWVTEEGDGSVLTMRQVTSSTNAGYFEKYTAGSLIWQRACYAANSSSLLRQTTDFDVTTTIDDEGGKFYIRNVAFDISESTMTLPSGWSYTVPASGLTTPANAFMAWVGNYDGTMFTPHCQTSLATKKVTGAGNFINYDADLRQDRLTTTENWQNRPEVTTK